MPEVTRSSTCRSQPRLALRDRPARQRRSRTDNRTGRDEHESERHCALAEHDTPAPAGPDGWAHRDRDSDVRTLQRPGQHPNDPGNEEHPLAPSPHRRRHPHSTRGVDARENTPVGKDASALVADSEHGTWHVRSRRVGRVPRRICRSRQSRPRLHLPGRRTRQDSRALLRPRRIRQSLRRGCCRRDGKVYGRPLSWSSRFPISVARAPPEPSGRLLKPKEHPARPGPGGVRS